MHVPLCVGVRASIPHIACGSPLITHADNVLSSFLHFSRWNGKVERLMCYDKIIIFHCGLCHEFLYSFRYPVRTFHRISYICVTL